MATRKSAKSLKQGDRVAWETSQGTTTGRVKKKVTRRTRIKGHEAAATKSDPQYVVETEETGKRAVHKASALKKRAAKKRTANKKSTKYKKQKSR